MSRKKEKAKVVELIALQEKGLSQIDDQITLAVSTTDAADKILKLQALENNIIQLDNDVSGKRLQIAQSHASRRAWQTAGIATVFTAAAIAVPAILVAAPIAIAAAGAPLAVLIPAGIAEEVARNKKEKKLLEQNPALVEFVAEIKTQKSRVQTMLEETVRDCSLKEISASPLFAKAYKEHEPLRDRFEAVAAAKRALGGDEPAAAVPENKPAAKPFGAYDNLRNI